MFDLKNNEFDWKSDQLEADVVFESGIDTPFSQKTFEEMEVGGSAENSARRWRGQGEVSSDNTSDTNKAPCTAEKSFAL